MPDVAYIVKNLENEIKFHNYKYWIENDPVISDEKYDYLMNELAEKDPNNPLLKFKGGVRLNLPKVKHEEPMLSLDKVYSVEHLLQWAKKVARNENEIFLLEPKYDGIAAKLDRQFSILSTSGDTGYEGENITSKTSLINFTISEKKSKNLRFIKGEIVFDKITFNEKKHKILRKNGKTYKIPRSAVVGLLSNDNIDATIGKVLTFVDYNWYSNEFDLNKLKYIDWDEYIQIMRAWHFPLDGLVLKLKDKYYFNSLGYTSHHYKGQMALKFGNPTGVTKLKDIELHSGKQSITPVGIIETVVIDGIDNSRASLHNWKYVIDNQINIGDTIEIERCGEIIPQFKRIIKKCETPKTINPICPDCGSQLIYDEPNLKCINQSCYGRLIRVLSDAVVRIGIEELGRGTVKKLVLEKYVKTLRDILNLTYDDVVALSGFATQSAMNLINEIRKVRDNPVHDYDILASFNISGIGTTLSKKILKHYTLEELMNLSVDDLQLLEQIGPERAILIESYLRESKDSVEQILSELTIKESKYTESKNSLKICFTGSNPLKRDEWIKIAEKNGFEYIKTVTKELNILVTDDINSNSNKNKKAQKYGCKIITYQQFTELLLDKKTK